MAEWLILLVFVPAIIVPIVLLVGFAGCSIDRMGLAVPMPEPPMVEPPSVDSAVGKSVSIITLTWTFADPAAATFEFEREKIPDRATEIFEASTSPFDDTGLEPATSYRYRVRAVFSDGETSGWSSPVTGTTLSFEPTFSETLIADEAGWEGYTLVQRIEAARLSRSGTQVKLTLRASSVSDASIDRIYLSQPDPTGDPYDSAADLIKVHDTDDGSSAIVVPANTAVTLPATIPAVNYNLDEGRPLLIAVDFSGAPPSGISYRDAVLAEEAVGYWHAGAEAAVRDRAPAYTPEARIYLVEKIEVG